MPRRYKPQLILISAGYDAHLDDPLADCAVTVDGFTAISALMRELADELQVPLGGVLEGGYAVHALAQSVAATLQALRPGVAAPGPGPLHPLVAEALERACEFWPGLD